MAFPVLSARLKQGDTPAACVFCQPPNGLPKIAHGRRGFLQRAAKKLLFCGIGALFSGICGKKIWKYMTIYDIFITELYPWTSFGLVVL